MPHTRNVILAGVIALAAGHAAAQKSGEVDVFWSNPQGGFWSDASNWSPGVVPNNDGPSLFNASLNLQGKPYTVWLDIDATVQNFSLLWGAATLDLGWSTLTVNQGMTVRRGTVVGSGKFDQLTVGVGGVFRLEDATLSNLGTIRSQGTLLIEQGEPGNGRGGSGGTIVDTTGVDHRGPGSIDWTGGSVGMLRGGSLTNGPASTMTVTGEADKELTGDGTGAVHNDGVVAHGDASRGGGVGLTTITGVSFINSGAVVVNAGNLVLDPVNSLAPEGVLSAGSWTVRNASLLRFGQATPLIRTIAADLTLVGNEARFLDSTGQNAVQRVNRIAPDGQLKLREGRTLSVLNDLTVENLLSVEGAPPQGVPDPGRVVIPDGTADVDGVVTFKEASTLELIFNGRQPDFYGQVLARTAVVEPGATLMLTVNPGVVLHVGDTFDLVRAGVFQGQFTNLVGLDLGDGRFFEVIQNDGGVTAFITPPECAVDLVFDGILNFYDIAAFIRFFQEGHPVADFNHDGVFDFFDISAFVVAFSRGCG